MPRWPEKSSALLEESERTERASEVIDRDPEEALDRLAPVIKAADPSALVLGYGSWGAVDLVYSASDMNGTAAAASASICATVLPPLMLVRRASVRWVGAAI